VTEVPEASREPERLHALGDLVRRELPLSGPLGVELRRWDEGGLEVWAPAEPNRNVHGTLFGGSLAAVALLAGWGLVRLELQDRAIDAEVVVQDSALRYERPVLAGIRAVALHPPTGEWDRFLRAVRRRGRGRIAVRVELTPDDADTPVPAVIMEARYVAVAAPH
jgi:thioesterase domain-containing protein